MTIIDNKNIDITTAIEEIKNIIRLVGDFVYATSKSNTIMKTDFQASQNPTVVALVEQCNTISKENKMNKKFSFKKDEDFYKLDESITEYEEKLYYKMAEKQSAMQNMLDLDMASHGDTWHKTRRMD